jgi:hypothetical protein
VIVQKIHLTFISSAFLCFAAFFAFLVSYLCPQIFIVGSIILAALIISAGLTFLVAFLNTLSYFGVHKKVIIKEVFKEIFLWTIVFFGGLILYLGVINDMS